MATKSSIMDTNSYSDDYSSLLSNTTRDMINRREKWMGGESMDHPAHLSLL